MAKSKKLNLSPEVASKIVLKKSIKEAKKLETKGMLITNSKEDAYNALLERMDRESEYAIKYSEKCTLEWLILQFQDIADLSFTNRDKTAALREIAILKGYYKNAGISITNVQQNVNVAVKEIQEVLGMKQI